MVNGKKLVRKNDNDAIVKVVHFRLFFSSELTYENHDAAETGNQTLICSMFKLTDTGFLATVAAVRTSTSGVQNTEITQYPTVIGKRLKQALNYRHNKYFK